MHDMFLSFVFGVTVCFAPFAMHTVRNVDTPPATSPCRNKTLHVAFFFKIINLLSCTTQQLHPFQCSGLCKNKNLVRRRCNCAQFVRCELTISDAVLQKCSSRDKKWAHLHSF